MSKFFNKQTVTSFILGLIIAGSVPSFAAISSSTVQPPKPINLKYQVNGKVLDIKTPPTLTSVRPIIEALGATVIMDSASNTVFISSYVQPNEEQPNMLATSDGLQIHDYNGKGFVRITDIHVKYENINLNFDSKKSDFKAITYYTLKIDDVVVLSSFPSISIENFSCIKADYYTDNIQPLLEKYYAEKILPLLND